MITTPVSARGLDFEDVGVVINYDLPSADHGGIGEYVHRIGRTARIGHRGLAISYFNERNMDIAADLTATLLEQSQSVPDFLEEHKPADGNLVFSDDVVEGANAGEDDGWGAPAQVGGAEAKKDDAWESFSKAEDEQASGW